MPYRCTSAAIRTEPCLQAGSREGRGLHLLTGIGGSGKTRLAIEVARDLVAAYPDGAWLVELASLSEEALVPKAAAEALELPERPAEPLVDTLSEALRDRQLLLILDNCEHLLEASARLVPQDGVRKIS